MIKDQYTTVKRVGITTTEPVISYADIMLSII